MGIPWCEGDQLKLDSSLIAENNSYIRDLGRSVNMENKMKEELGRRKRAAWAFQRSDKETEEPENPR